MEVKYPPKTAGRIMTDKVPTIHDNATVGDVEALLMREAANFDTINYIYLLSADKKLKGVISLKELFRSPKTKLVKDLTPERVISVHAHTHQEKAALLALKNNLKVLPVVDKENNFLGVMTSDSIMKILDSEAVENILRFGGVTHGTYDNIFNIPILTSLKHRLPWLILGLVGGMFTAGLVHSFEKILSQNLILAAFIPLIVYMADAVGTQMEAFIIRDLAVEPDLKFFRYFFRQLGIMLIIAVIVSVGLYGFNLMISQDGTVSFILSVAMFVAIISSVLTGLIIPYLFGKLSLDPANASGPIGTIIQDFLSVFIYFTVASRLLS